MAVLGGDRRLHRLKSLSRKSFGRRDAGGAWRIGASAHQERHNLIREQTAEQPLFYSSQEIAQPAAGNFYRRLARLGDWRELAAPFAAAFCAGLGRPTDPVVYLKIFLVGYLENITYDTDLAERIADSLAIREFLGYSLSEETPAHDAISRNRARIGERCSVEEVLGPVVKLCQEAGLVSGEEAALDSSLIPANASLSSLRSVKTGKGVREHPAGGEGEKPPGARESQAASVQ
jgi:transposase